MIAIEYQLGGEYQRERQREAAADRLARSCATACRRTVLRREVEPAGQRPAWIDSVVRLVPRRFSQAWIRDTLIPNR